MPTTGCRWAASAASCCSRRWTCPGSRWRAWPQVVGRGEFSLDFIEAAGYDAFAPLGSTTFAQVATESGIPIELLMAIREVIGGMPPRPDDRMREDELAIVPLVQLQVGEGFRPVVIERTLRVYGDSLRRMSETEGEWWRSEVQDAMLSRGLTEKDVAAYAHEMSPRLSQVSDQAILAIYHAQQRLAWSANIVGGIAGALVRAGLHTRSERPPAMCFLDISGYTRLTAERGDSAAAALAEQVARLVQRTALQHGGRPVKWLGDGVMLYFPEAGPGVLAALGMLEGVAEAGLPPAHIGLHAGPILFQEGDYYGQTVNVAARIGEYARPGEVLVSQEVVEAAGELPRTFRQIGPVELKGVGGVMQLHQAVRAG
ncbi:MAG: adenylate/guanylate cyclase domain-containing protein [Candidatus Limnocylindria bacterium]